MLHILTLCSPGFSGLGNWRLDPYVAKGISPRAGQVQRIVLGLLSILKSIARVKYLAGWFEGPSRVVIRENPSSCLSDCTKQAIVVTWRLSFQPQPEIV